MSELRSIRTSHRSVIIAIGVVTAFVLTAFFLPPRVIASDPPVASSITISGIKDPIYVGESTGFTVSVLDQYGAVFTAYDGTITFFSTDHSAILPAQYTFTLADSGVHTFANDSLVFNTVGEQGLNVTDNATLALVLGTITVMPLDVTPHDTIRILSDSDFNATNGVISGNGTASNPYLIANLQLDIKTPDGGIEIHNTSSYFVIQHVRIANDGQLTATSLRLDGVKNATLRDVEVTYAERIITLNHCEDIFVNNITTTFSGTWALVANDSNYVTVSRLYFEQMLDGVEMFGCDNSTISNNTIYTSDYGVYLVGCRNVEVSGNQILSNDHGITLKSSTGVVVLHNNIWSAWTWPGYDDSPASNHWDGGYPACGNYWARYTGSDSNCGPLQVIPGSDGIGDTPYDTGYGAIDNFPLMVPWAGHLDLPPILPANAHAPISISGDADFTAHNGVTGGNGTLLDPYIIEGWSINSGGDLGIAVRGTNAYFVIRNVTIYSNVSGWQIGIYFDSVNNAILEYDNCTNQLYGMQLQYCTNLLILNNSCALDGVGIWIESSLNSTIRHNILSNNTGGGLSVYQSTLTTIFDNNCSYNPGGAGIDCTSQGATMIEHNTCIGDAEGIGLIGPTQGIIENNTVLQNGEGMQVVFAPDTLIRNNTFSSNGDTQAITIWESNRVVAVNNTFTNESMAFNVDSSSSCIIENNTCSGGRAVDIGVYFCGDNRIANNTLHDGAWDGILLQYADGNVICHNLISGEGGYAVDLYEACSNNTIWNNTFAGNMRSGTSYDPLRAQANDNGTNNHWNSSGTPHGYGNYWSDWTQPDNNSDGIVDLPYAMNGSAGALDNYPLAGVTYLDLEPPVTVALITGSTGANGFYVSNVTISLNPTDDKSGVLGTYWTIDGAHWENYTEPFILTGGEWNILFYSVDKSGNIEQQESITVRVDPLPPTTSLIVAGLLGNQGWYVSDVNISVVVTLPPGCVLNSTHSRISGGDWESNVTTIDLSADGPTTVYCYSDDMAGNVEQVKSLALKIDRTPPTMSLSMANGTVLNTQTAVVAWTSTDSMSGINHFEVRLDGLLVSSPNMTQAWIQLSSLALGSHVLTVRSFDNAGNVAEVNVSFDVGLVGVPEFAGGIALPIILFIGILVAVNLRGRKR